MTGAPDPSDEVLMQAYAAGDAAAFEQLYRRHRGWLYATLSRQLADRAAADDVFQETWYSLIRSAPTYKPAARFTTWLYLLARQRLVDHWRKTNPDSVLVPFNDDGNDNEDQDTHAPADYLFDERDDPARRVETRQQGDHIVAALAQLSPVQREAFLLAEHAGMSLAEIAVATGSAHEAVKSRLRYARSKLLALLEKGWR